MTTAPFHVELDPATIVVPPPAGTLSRTVHADDDLKVVVFGFAEGEELSEHTSSKPAVILVLRGELELTLEGERITAREGAWIHMGAGVRHAVTARTAAVMLLTLLHRSAGGG